MDATTAATPSGPLAISAESLAIFGNIFDFYGLLDNEGRVDFLSGRVFEMTNANPILLKGQVFPDTVFWQSSEITPKLLSKAIAKAAAGEASKQILDFRVSADEKVAMEVFVQHLAERNAIFVSGQSVSERKDRVRQSRGASEQLLFAAENSAIGLWFWDFSGDRIHATPRFNEIFGLPAYETFRYEKYRDAIHPDDRSFVDEFLTASREDGSEYKEEFRILHQDGSIEWVCAEGRSFLDDIGKPTRMSGVVQEITEQKFAAAEVAKIHDREKKAREEAVEANRSKDFFLAFVSHELRSPLNAILGWAKILLSKELDATTQRNALETIERSARFQTKLINDLVDSARVASGKLRLEYRPTNLYDIVRNSWQALMPIAEGKNVDLTFTSDSESIPLFGDASRLQQVFGNLISNAIKFTPEGGHISVEVFTSDDQARVQVTDSGHGIDPVALPHIFKQFSQGGDAEQTKANMGLGLGLSIVKILITRHGGVVHAESEGMGKGSRFTVTLPLTETAILAEPEPVLQPVKHQPLEGNSIFIVEDDPDSREVLELFLAQNGADVKSFDSVRGALADFGSNGTPNIIISDLGMPDEDGYSLISKIRAFAPESGGRVPAIALSAFTSEESKQKALELGFNRYRTKPFEHDLLIRDLLELLESSTGPSAQG